VVGPNRADVEVQRTPGVQRFRGGLVFKTHRLLYHSTVGLRVIKKEREYPRCWTGWPRRSRAQRSPAERDFFIDNLVVRIHSINVMIRWTGLAPWGFEFPFPGSLTSTFLDHLQPPFTFSVSRFGFRVQGSGFRVQGRV